MVWLGHRIRRRVTCYSRANHGPVCKGQLPTLQDQRGESSHFMQARPALLLD